MVSLTLNKIQVILIAIIVPIVLVYLLYNFQSIGFNKLFLPDVPLVHVNDITFRVEIADTPQERTQGLSGREALDTVEGLLFVFPESAQHSMWMKDMLFSIDIIWIDEDFEIIEIQKNITPDTWPQKFRPSRPAKYAIETNIHFSETFGFREGMQVKLPREVVE